MPKMLKPTKSFSLPMHENQWFERSVGDNLKRVQIETVGELLDHHLEKCVAIRGRGNQFLAIDIQGARPTRRIEERLPVRPRIGRPAFTFELGGGACRVNRGSLRCMDA